MLSFPSACLVAFKTYALLGLGPNGQNDNEVELSSSPFLFEVKKEQSILLLSPKSGLMIQSSDM